MRKVDVGTLNLSQKHIDKVVEALKSNRLSYGPMTNEFEQKFSKLHKNKYGIFTNSGTSALQVALNAMKILYGWQDGDEVILPATTFVATYNVVLHNNLTPILADIGFDKNLNPLEFRKKITKRTRAVIPVHLLGKPADMEEINKIARKHKIKVIEDSCESMFMKGIGTGDVACFSFYIAHLITTGVGGMAITNNQELADLMRSLIFHGRDHAYLNIDDDDDPDDLLKIIESRFRFNYPGYSYRGTEMEAALGLVELENWKEMIKKRQTNAKYLVQHLFLEKTWDDPYWQNHAFMMFPFVVPKDDRDPLMFYMEKRGITTRTLMPLITQPYIAKTIDENDYPRAQSINWTWFLFGCHQDLTKADLDYIIKTIADYR